MLDSDFSSYLDSAAFVKAKINNQSVLCLSYTQALRYVYPRPAS